jgi:integrase
MRHEKVPSLTRHKDSSQGVVRLNGVDHYCGPWPSGQRKPPPDVRARYDAFISEWLVRGRVALPADDRPLLTVAELLAAFLARSETHYRDQDGNPTTEVANYRMALRPVRHLYADLPAADFSPLKLKAIRRLMLDGYTHPKYGEQPSLARKVVNQRIGRITRVWKWAVSEELVPVAVYQELKSVEGLAKGRTEARETEAVTPVAVPHVEATLPFLLPPVQAMVRLQMHTGMRPGEVCAMRACDIDMTGKVWLYRPRQHKTAHRGKSRVIAIGPKAQEVLRPWLKLDTQAYLFSPAEAMELQRAARAAKRKTAASRGNRPGSNRKRKPAKKPGSRYTIYSYYTTIRRAVERADLAARKKATAEALAAGEQPPGEDVVFVPHWHANQLRHSHASEVRRRYGLEAAQVALGHSQANVTEIYAERDMGLAVRVALEIG